MSILTECIRGGSSTGRSGFLIKFDYDADIVEQFKRTIPTADREWNPVVKTWWISETKTFELMRLFSNFEALVFLQGKLM